MLRSTLTSQMLLKALSIDPKTRITAQNSMTSATAATTPPWVRPRAFSAKIDDVAHHLGVLGEEPVEARGESVGQPEALDHGEDHGGDGHERHERVEGQRGAADQRSVFDQPAGRIEEQPVLLHEPPHQRDCAIR